MYGSVLQDEERSVGVAIMVAQQCARALGPSILYLKTAKRVNFLLCVFYHDLKKINNNF